MLEKGGSAQRNLNGDELLIEAVLGGDDRYGGMSLQVAGAVPGSDTVTCGDTDNGKFGDCASDYTVRPMCCYTTPFSVGSVEGGSFSVSSYASMSILESVPWVNSGCVDVRPAMA